MHYIGLGRTSVLLLSEHLDICVIHAATGELIRALTINPEHRWHGTGQPPGGPKGPQKSDEPNPNRGSVRPGCLATSQCGAGGNRFQFDHFGECQLVADSAPDLVFREVDVLACAN